MRVRNSASFRQMPHVETSRRCSGARSRQLPETQHYAGMLECTCACPTANPQSVTSAASNRLVQLHTSSGKP